MTARASAARYARALLDVTIQEAGPEQVESELAGFVDLVQTHADLRRALTNPAVSVVAKRKVLEQVLPLVPLSPPLRKLLLLLADRDRLALLPDLLAVYRERLMEHRRIVRAEVTTAIPLTAERASQLQERLAQVTGRTVTMTTKVDPSIIGGVVARVGSTVYDGSVATQLARLRTRLMQRV